MAAKSEGAKGTKDWGWMAWLAGRIDDLPAMLRIAM